MNRAGKPADLEQHIRNMVAAWPPLTPDQRDKLTIIFRRHTT